MRPKHFELHYLGATLLALDLKHFSTVEVKKLKKVFRSCKNQMKSLILSLSEAGVDGSAEKNWVDQETKI
jgi:hypothetical protein